MERCVGVSNHVDIDHGDGKHGDAGDLYHCLGHNLFGARGGGHDDNIVL